MNFGGKPRQWWMVCLCECGRRCSSIKTMIHERFRWPLALIWRPHQLPVAELKSVLTWPRAIHLCWYDTPEAIVYGFNAWGSGTGTRSLQTQLRYIGGKVINFKNLNRSWQKQILSRNKLKLTKGEEDFSPRLAKRVTREESCHNASRQTCDLLLRRLTALAS